MGGLTRIERRGAQARSVILSRGRGREAQAPLFRHLLGFEGHGRLPVSPSLTPTRARHARVRGHPLPPRRVLGSIFQGDRAQMCVHGRASPANLSSFEEKRPPHRWVDLSCHPPSINLLSLPILSFIYLCEAEAAQSLPYTITLQLKLPLQPYFSI